MSIAHAAEVVAGAAGHEAFYDSPEFWVSIAFVLTVGAAGKTVFKKITAALDERSEGIRNQIEEATRLREEAQELLASYERKQRDAIEEARQIGARAQSEAEYLTKKAEDNLKNMLGRRERQAKERIAQAEATAIDQIRAAAIDVALEASKRLLAEKITGGKADALIASAIEELPGKLH